MTPARGDDVAIGVLEKLEQRYAFEAMPDLGLPSTVQTLDCGLEARLPRRSKNRDHTEQQAGSHDTADDIGVPIRADEHVAVVELHVARQPEFGPMLDEQNGCSFGCDRVLRPGRN